MYAMYHYRVFIGVLGPTVNRNNASLTILGPKEGGGQNAQFVGNLRLSLKTHYFVLLSSINKLFTFLSLFTQYVSLFLGRSSYHGFISSYRWILVKEIFQKKSPSCSEGLPNVFEMGLENGRNGMFSSKYPQFRHIFNTRS